MVSCRPAVTTTKSSQFSTVCSMGHWVQGIRIRPYGAGAFYARARVHARTHVRAYIYIYIRTRVRKFKPHRAVLPQLHLKLSSAMDDFDAGYFMDDAVNNSLSILSEGEPPSTSTPNRLPSEEPSSVPSSQLGPGGNKSTESPAKSEWLKKCSCENGPISIHVVFHDDQKEKTFGIIKKGVYMPASDFIFELVAEVICEVPSSSGYLINLTPHNGNTRLVC